MHWLGVWRFLSDICPISSLQRKFAFLVEQLRALHLSKRKGSPQVRLPGMISIINDKDPWFAEAWLHHALNSLSHCIWAMTAEQSHMHGRFCTKHIQQSICSCKFFSQSRLTLKIPCRNPKPRTLQQRTTSSWMSMQKKLEKLLSNQRQQQLQRSRSSWQRRLPRKAERGLQSRFSTVTANQNLEALRLLRRSEDLL